MLTKELNALQHNRAKAHIQFYAFDILIHRARSVLNFPLEAQRELLGDKTIPTHACGY
jgi:ATP-dependent DNA ligase